MHARRIATFLLGVWLGCSGFMAYLVMENLRSAGRVMASASEPASQLFEKLGPEDAALLLRYQAAEQTRAYLFTWEWAQLVLAAALLLCLFLATEKRSVSLVLCGAMLVLLGFEHFALNPELAYRGRAADFPPGNRTFGTQTRLWALEQVYLSVEGTKLLIGGVLASYLFVFRARRVRKKIDAVNDPDHSHVDG